MAPAGRGRGVTLLELLVVVALLGVLCSMAYPSYRNHLLRAHRTEAIESLLTLAAAQERFHLEHGRYADGFEPEAVPGLAVARVSATGRYRLSLSQPGPGRFAAHAMPAPGSGQHEDGHCSEFGLDDSGRRWALDREGRSVTAQCWR